jgi:hypothetical protein
MGFLIKGMSGEGDGRRGKREAKNKKRIKEAIFDQRRDLRGSLHTVLGNQKN